MPVSHQIPQGAPIPQGESILDGVHKLIRQFTQRELKSYLKFIHGLLIFPLRLFLRKFIQPCTYNYIK